MTTDHVGPTALDQPPVVTSRLLVGGMSCAACAARIERRLNRLEGVAATVNYATETATITHPSSTMPEALIDVVVRTGYTATTAGARVRSERTVDVLERRRLLASVLLALPVVALAMVPRLQFSGWQWVSLVLTTPVVVWGAAPFHRGAWASVRQGAATMDTLVSVGTLAAYCWSVARCCCCGPTPAPGCCSSRPSSRSESSRRSSACPSSCWLSARTAQAGWSCEATHGGRDGRMDIRAGSRRRRCRPAFRSVHGARRTQRQRQVDVAQDHLPRAETVRRSAAARRRRPLADPVARRRPTRRRPGSRRARRIRLHRPRVRATRPSTTSRSLRPAATRRPRHRRRRPRPNRCLHLRVETAVQSVRRGERQRVLLSRALAQRPAVLVLDEPTNHLDPRHQFEALELVRSLGLTVVTALHSLDLATLYADELVVVDHGQITASGPPIDVLTTAVLQDVFGVIGGFVPDPFDGHPRLVLRPTPSASN